MDESGWDPMPSATARRELVPVRIAVHEVKLREKVKAAGGRWDPEKRVWHVSMEQVLQLGLGGRVARVGPIPPPDPAGEQPEEDV